MDNENQDANFGLNAWMRAWNAMANSAAEACQAWEGSTASPDAVRDARSMMFKAWSDSWEQFLRSPAFLEATRQSLAANVETRKQVHEYLARLHREFQLASCQDIDQVVQVLQRLERRLLDEFEQVSTQLESVSTRLNSLAARLDALENGVAPKEQSHASRKREGKGNQGAA